MRTIKFRARSLTQDERWLFGSYLTRLNSREGREHIIVGDDGVEHYCDTTTLGQFTGLLDRNGKEIYEGDILRIGAKDPAEVKWLYGEMRVGNVPFSSYWNWPFNNIEIIGNIYENSEFLK